MALQYKKVFSVEITAKKILFLVEAGYSNDGKTWCQIYIVRPHISKELGAGRTIELVNKEMLIFLPAPVLKKSAAGLKIAELSLRKICNK